MISLPLESGGMDGRSSRVLTPAEDRTSARSAAARFGIWVSTAEFAQTVTPRRVAVLRSRNGSAPQPAATAADAATQNRWSELKTA
jgi:hypothetical protein